MKYAYTTIYKENYLDRCKVKMRIKRYKMMVIMVSVDDVDVWMFPIARSLICKNMIFFLRQAILASFSNKLYSIPLDTNDASCLPTPMLHSNKAKFNKKFHRNHKAEVSELLV